MLRFNARGWSASRWCARQQRCASTLIEKIVQRHVSEGSTAAAAASAGQYVSLRPSHCMTHDNSYFIIAKFDKLQAQKVSDPSQLVFTLDHDIQNTSEANLARYAKIEAFAAQHRIDFYPAGRGIGHQVMCEELYALPGSLCVASDSHSNMYGGLGCLGTPVVRSDAASIWTTSRTWWRVPPVCRVRLTGALPEHSTGKDVILALCSHFGDEVLNHAVEFEGPGVATLGVEERLTIANMSTEWGALCGVFPPDHVALEWVRGRAAAILQERPGTGQPLSSAGWRAERALRVVEELERSPLVADTGCTYARTLHLDLSTVEPLVNGPNSVSAGKLPAEERRKIHKAWLMSCVNSRAGDLAAAAQVFQGGKKVAPWVEFYVAAASSEVQAEAEREGHWQTLLDAGAIPLPPGCGACAGLGSGTIGQGEVGVASTNRNFRGRMGHRDAEVYLASPSTVAASAIEGYIASAAASAASGESRAAALGGGTRASESVTEELGLEVGQQPAREGGAESGEGAGVPLVPGFPQELRGDLVYCTADGISTDGIYHGRLMYEDLTREQMAEAAMENYDPDFRRKLLGLRRPAVLACGSNFGTGSSREQAAQCLQYAGVTAIIAPSYSATFVRNALNNGLPIFESPALVDYLRARYASVEDPTITTDLSVAVDFSKWSLKVEGDDAAASFPIVPIGAAAQELIAQGGLEQWIRSQLASPAAALRAA